MAEPGTRREHGAHRAEPKGLQGKPLLWALLAGAVVVVLTSLGFLLPWGGQDESRGERTDATTVSEQELSNSPVVVGPTETEAANWTEVLADPAVELGRSRDDEGTKALIARALHEAQDDPRVEEQLDQTFKLRALNEGDITPVVDAPQRMDNSEKQAASGPTESSAPEDEPAPAAAAGAAPGGPAPTHTVVTRGEWEEWESAHPQTKLVASTPGGKDDSEFSAVDDTTLQKSLDQWAQLAKPFHSLVAIDVSGSMGYQALPNGATRMDLTAGAAVAAVEMFPDHDALGLWVFSRNLDGAKDYMEIAPVEELGAEENGMTHRENLLANQSALQYMQGSYTGLYDTTLAAFRQVLEDDAPDSLKTVIVLTDGEDIDEGSIGLENLLKALEDEQDPESPVRIITVGISADANEDVLKQISEATGGSSHIAEQPEDIQDVFIEALTGI